MTVEQVREGERQPAGGRRVLITQFQLRLSEVCSSSSAECILGCILGISESLTEKPTRRKVSNNLQSNKMSKVLQICGETCVGDISTIQNLS